MTSHFLLFTSHLSPFPSHNIVGAAFPDIFSSLVRERSRSKIIPASLLLEAYCTGIFPMAMENGDIAWFSPDPRGIIPLDAFHIPHGLKRSLKKEEFQIRLNTAFEAVIRACGERAETWISEEIIESYINLHRLGFAHSVEAGLVNRLNERGFRLLDTQYVTGHLTMFGAVEISRPKYMRLLKQALALDCKFI